MSQRPIVYYQNLMPKYDASVTALMLAKTDYILFTDEPVTEPIVVETLWPHVPAEQVGATNVTKALGTSLTSILDEETQANAQAPLNYFK